MRARSFLVLALTLWAAMTWSVSATTTAYSEDGAAEAPPPPPAPKVTVRLE